MIRQIIARRSAEEVEIVRLTIPPGNLVPNNPFHPAVIARDVLGGPHEGQAVCDLMERNGWAGTWTSVVFDYHHYHPDAFEALAVASGSAVLTLGGPQGSTVEVHAGDVMILPPGFGHKCLAMQDGFRICGAYPPGQEGYTTIRASSRYDEAILRQIEAVASPLTDPVMGTGGPLLKALLGN